MITLTPLVYNLEYINAKAKTLKAPIIHTDIEIPKSRAIHTNMLNLIEEDNYESLADIRKIEADKYYFYNVETLHNPIGKIRETNKPTANYKNGIKKLDGHYRVVDKTDKINATSRDLMVFNYKSIYINAIYQVHALRNYYIARNALNTLVDNINKTSMFIHNLVLFDIPTDIPTIATITEANRNGIHTGNIKKFTDINSFVLLELWKLMYKDSDSVFHLIDKTIVDKVYFVFRYKNKNTVYRLSDLMSLSKDLEVKGRFTGKDSLTAAKIVYATLMLYKIRSNADESVLKGIDANQDDDIDITTMDDKQLDMYLQDIGVNTTEEEIVDEVEQPTETTPTEIVSKPVNTFKDATSDVKELLTAKIDKAIISKKISKAEAAKLTDILDTQGDNEFIINNEPMKLKDILDYEQVDIKIRALPIQPSKTIIDSTMVDNTNIEFDKKYLEKMYHKDVYNAIYGVQNMGFVVANHSVSERKSYMGVVEEHKVEVRPVNGGMSSTLVFVIPKIDMNDGTYMMSANEYILREQRKDLPIRKTSPTSVLLTSYTGKLFIEKNLLQKNHPSIWLGKVINTDDRFSNIIMKKNNPYGLDLIKDYTMFGSILNRFTFDKKLYVFDYNNRLSVLPDLDAIERAKKMEIDNDAVLISSGKDTLLYMKKDGSIISSTSNSKPVEISTDIYSHLGLDISSMPTEFSVISILGKTIPLGLVMLYYIGLDKILEILNIDKRVYTNEDKYKVLGTEFAIELSDGKIVFDKSNRRAMLLLSGIPKEISKNLTISMLNNKTDLSGIFNLMGLPLAHSTYIDTIEDVFIDNITRDTLRLMNEPTDIHRLFIRASDLLVDDNYKNPNNISENSIVRYERVAGLINKTLSDAVKVYNAKNVLSRAKLTIDPYSIWKAIGDDSTSMLVSNNNPIDTIKQRDNVTYLGEFGRNKITMTVASRAMTPEEIGIMSEATPDSGDSGISTYLTHAASIDNLRGMVSPIDMNNYTINKALSTANIINPFITHDDSKRSNFASIQSSHGIPMRVMKSNWLWTGGESSIASKVGKPFVFTAESLGVVESITKSKVVIKYSKPKKTNLVYIYYTNTDKMSDIELITTTVTYLNSIGYNATTDTKDKTKYKIAINTKMDGMITVSDIKLIKTQLASIPKAVVDSYSKTYSLRSWASKVEANQSLKHNMTTTLREGQVVNIGDVLVYDESYFEPNIYDPKSIILKMGATYNIAFVENKTTYEDSVEINSKILADTGEVKYKILSKVVDVTSHIANVIPEGSKVTYGDKLMTILDNTLLMDSTLTDKAKEILSEASDSSPTANANGVIDRIDVIYNCELDDMDSSIRALADISNKRFKDELGTDGRVTSEYSIAGVPLAANQIELKYYISYSADTKIGDKFVIGHQLKCTVGAIKTSIETEDGEPVDFIFSNKSVLARITNSSYLVGAVNILMADIIKEAITAYRK